MFHDPHPRPAVVDFEALPSALDLPGAALIRAEGRRAWFRIAQTNGGAGIAELTPALFRDYRVRDVSLMEPEIEDVARGIYEGKTDASQGSSGNAWAV